MIENKLQETLKCVNNSISWTFQLWDVRVVWLNGWMRMDEVLVFLVGTGTRMEALEVSLGWGLG